MMLETGNYKDIVFAKGTNTNMGARLGVYLYNVDGLLVDCGPQSMQTDIAEFLLSQKLSKLVLTHMHEDHCGMASWVSENLGIPIYIDAADIPEAQSEGEYGQYRRLTWGDRHAFYPIALPEKIETEKYSFDVIAAPGHVAHHSVFFEQNQGWLFAGDLYVRGKIRFGAAEEDMKMYMSSLERVIELDFDTLFCAHAGVVENGRQRLEEKLSFLKELQYQINELRKKGFTDREIDCQLFPDNQLIAEVSGGDWCSYNIIKTI